jgi:hypothetical protein
LRRNNQRRFRLIQKQGNRGEHLWFEAPVGVIDMKG